MNPNPLSSAAMYSVLGQTLFKNNVLINNSYATTILIMGYSLHLFLQLDWVKL